jgi:hypothetical protein
MWLRFDATSGKVAGSNLGEDISKIVLELTQPLTGKSARNIPEGKVPPEREAHKVTAICEPTV